MSTIYADKPPKMSLEDATELAARLHSVLSFHAIPPALEHYISVEISELFNYSDGQSATENKPAHIRDVLLGYTGNVEAIKRADVECTLPELLSQVMKHPDLNGEMRSKIWEFFQLEIGNQFGNWDSPEWFAAVTGIKAKGFNKPTKKGRK